MKPSCPISVFLASLLLGSAGVATAAVRPAVASRTLAVTRAPAHPAAFRAALRSPAAVRPHAVRPVRRISPAQARFGAAFARPAQAWRRPARVFRVHAKWAARAQWAPRLNRFVRHQTPPAVSALAGAEAALLR